MARRLLSQLERTNLFLISLPREEGFRFQHLFRGFASAAREAERPDRASELHRRAVVWFRSHGQVEEAIHHACAAGDHDTAAQLIQANWLRYFDAGRSATVFNWLRELRPTTADNSPAASTTAAWMAALSGNDVEMRRRLAQLESMSGDEPLPDGTRSPRSALVLIRGLFGFDRPDRMLADSREAVQLETDSATPWFAVARASLGYAAFVIGDMALARANLSEAAHASATPTTIRLIALSTLALCEAEHGNTARSASLATQAMQIVTDHTIEAIPHAIFAYTAYGRSLADAGRLVEAAVALEEGLKSRRQLPGLSPWPLIQHLTVMASVATRSHNDAAADQILAEVDALTPWTGQSMRATRERIHTAPVADGSNIAFFDDPLTPREEQILLRLQGTQTLREIANDLFVSINTVKTICQSTYRKLGVHSRTEAVATTRLRHRSRRVDSQDRPVGAMKDHGYVDLRLVRGPARSERVDGPQLGERREPSRSLDEADPAVG